MESPPAAGSSAPSVGPRVDPSYVRQLIPSLAANGGVDKRVHADGLRHTHAAELAREGNPVNLIHDEIGHRCLATTDRYLRDIAPGNASPPSPPANGSRRGSESHGVDIQMPVEEGLNTIAALRGRSPRLRIVACSFHHEAATKERALAQGADAYLDKPVGGNDLKRVLQRLSEEPPPGSRAPVRNHPCEGYDGLTRANPDNLAIWSPSTTSDAGRGRINPPQIPRRRSVLNGRDLEPEATPAEVPAAAVKETASPIPKATPEAEVPAPAPGTPTKTTKAGRPKKAKTAKARPKKKKKASAKGKAKKAKR